MISLIDGVDTEVLAELSRKGMPVVEGAEKTMKDDQRRPCTVLPEMEDHGPSMKIGEAT